MPSAERIADALETLDPEDRALLELSARRGFGDEEIGDLLGVDAGEVAHRRHEALEDLAYELELDDARAAEDELAAHWSGDEEPADEEPADEEPVAAAPSERPTRELSRPAATGASRAGVASPLTPARSSSNRRPLTLGLLALAAAVGLVIAIVAASGGGDEPAKEQGAGSGSSASKSETDESSAPEEDAPAEGAEPVRMQRLNGTYGRGTAQVVDGSRLRLAVNSFLQPQGGGYAVWLYNSQDDARRLYATEETSIEREIPLPDGWEEYRFVEVARAVPDLDSDHSGISLLRVRVSDLSG